MSAFALRASAGQVGRTMSRHPDCRTPLIPAAGFVRCFCFAAVQGAADKGRWAKVRVEERGWSHLFLAALADGRIVAERISGGAPVGTPTNWGSANWGAFQWSGSPTPAWLYFVLDHLGSISVITDQSGAVVTGGRLSYDAWGKRRNADGSDAASCMATTNLTTRGFTGQEEMDSICAVNLNARIYDPTLGKFLSADPIVGTPFDPQQLNRYTYVLNNPLSLTDPSGLCFLGCFWKSPVFAAIVAVAVLVVAPILEYGSLSAFSAAITSGDLSAIGYAALNGAIAGGISSGLSGGNVLQGILYGGVTGALFAGVGVPLGQTLGHVLGQPLIGNVIAQGLVGGLNSVIQGGNFGAGFLAAGVGSLAGPILGNRAEITPKGLIVSAALGGAASVLGGGKFFNGAITGAFAYMATAKYGTEDARTGNGSMGPETGDDAPVDLAKFSGVTRCGNSLCGNIPYVCLGTSCTAVVDQLQTFIKDLSFNLAFSPATDWQAFKSWLGFGEVLDINFGPTYTVNGETTLGEGGGGVMNLLGSSWQTDPRIINHEFLHNLGLGHNTEPGTLMYPHINRGATMPQPGELQNLLNAYGR